MPAVRATGHLLLLDRKGPNVVAGEQALVRLEIVGDSAADLAVIEIITTSRREPRDRPRQVRLYEPVPFLVPASVAAEEDALRLRTGAQLPLETRIGGPRLRAAPEPGDVRKDLEPFFREPLRR